MSVYNNSQCDMILKIPNALQNICQITETIILKNQ